MVCPDHQILCVFDRGECILHEFILSFVFPGLPKGPPGLPGLKGDSGPKGEKVRITHMISLHDLVLMSAVVEASCRWQTPITLLRYLGCI